VALNFGLALRVLLSSPHSNMRIIVVGGPDLRTLNRSRLCARYYPHDLALSPSGICSFLAILRSITSLEGNLLVVPVDQDAAAMIFACQRSQGFSELASFPVSAPDVVGLLDDKWRFTTFCRENKIAVPRTIFVGNKFDFDYDRAASIVGFPIVVKPTNEAFSYGVRVIRNRREYEQHIRLNGSYAFAPIIAQQYVAGCDFSIGLLASKGKILNFAIHIPSDEGLLFIRNTKIHELASRLVAILNYSGALDLDGRLDPMEGAFFVEANPRFWGSLLAATWCGLNFVRAGISLAIGDTCPVPRTIADVRYPSLRGVCANLVMRRIRLSDLDADQRTLLRRVLLDPIILRKLWWL
jgi:predicted ATP-grasp superfamily ATP-dependent carboligase